MNIIVDILFIFWLNILGSDQYSFISDRFNINEFDIYIISFYITNNTLIFNYKKN